MEYLKCVLRSSNTDYLKLALNEIVIEHGTSQNLIDLNLFINEIFVTSFEVRLNFKWTALRNLTGWRPDPLNSWRKHRTLSSGWGEPRSSRGKYPYTCCCFWLFLFSPVVSCVLVTPMCPRSLAARPLMLPASVEMRLSLAPDCAGPAWVSCDGQQRTEMGPGDSLWITSGISTSVCLKVLGSNYYLP